MEVGVSKENPKQDALKDDLWKVTAFGLALALLLITGGVMLRSLFLPDSTLGDHLDALASIGRDISANIDWYLSISTTLILGTFVFLVTERFQIDRGKKDPSNSPRQNEDSVADIAFLTQIIVAAQFPIHALLSLHAIRSREQAGSLILTSSLLLIHIWMAAYTKRYAKHTRERLLASAKRDLHIMQEDAKRSERRSEIRIRYIALGNFAIPTIFQCIAICASSAIPGDMKGRFLLLSVSMTLLILGLAALKATIQITEIRFFRLVSNFTLVLIAFMIVSTPILVFPSFTGALWWSIAWAIFIILTISWPGRIPQRIFNLTLAGAISRYAYAWWNRRIERQLRVIKELEDG